jgi:hypothetical protein
MSDQVEITVTPTEEQLAPYRSILAFIDGAVQAIEYVAATGDVQKLGNGGAKGLLEEAMFEMQVMYRAWMKAEDAKEHHGEQFASEEEYLAAAEKFAQEADHGRS